MQSLPSPCLDVLGSTCPLLYHVWVIDRTLIRQTSYTRFEPSVNSIVDLYLLLTFFSSKCPSHINQSINQSITTIQIASTHLPWPITNQSESPESLPPRSLIPILSSFDPGSTLAQPSLLQMLQVLLIQFQGYIQRPKPPQFPQYHLNMNLKPDRNRDNPAESLFYIHWERRLERGRRGRKINQSPDHSPGRLVEPTDQIMLVMFKGNGRTSSGFMGRKNRIENKWKEKPTMTDCIRAGLVGGEGGLFPFHGLSSPRLNNLISTTSKSPFPSPSPSLHFISKWWLSLSLRSMSSVVNGYQRMLNTFPLTSMWFLSALGLDLKIKDTIAHEGTIRFYHLDLACVKAPGVCRRKFSLSKINYTYWNIFVRFVFKRCDKSALG